MTEKEREIEEAYKELEQIWKAEFEAKSLELEEENENIDTIFEGGDYDLSAKFYSEEDMIADKDDFLVKQRLREKKLYERNIREEILFLNERIAELEKRKCRLEWKIEGRFPSIAGDGKWLIPCWINQSKAFLERIQECIKRVENIKSKVLENYRIKVTPHGYTQRGSDNYWVSWSNIESYCYWEDDEYLNLPKVKIKLTYYSEKEEKEWVNPDYPTHEDRINAAASLETTYKAKIADYFDTKYNSDEHLSYLIRNCLKTFSESSSWDSQVFNPILDKHGFSKVAKILESIVPREAQFLVKRTLLNLLIEKLTNNQ